MRSPATDSAPAPPSICSAPPVASKASTSHAAIPTRGASTPTALMSRSSWPSRNSTVATGTAPRRPSTGTNLLARAGRVTHHALRLRLDSHALQNNWRWLQRTAGVPAGAAVKADGYGLGAREVMRLLGQAGCRDFF